LRSSGRSRYTMIPLLCPDTVVSFDCFDDCGLLLCNPVSLINCLVRSAFCYCAITSRNGTASCTLVQEIPILNGAMLG
jgi:hypothetical protein